MKNTYVPVTLVPYTLHSATSIQRGYCYHAGSYSSLFKCMYIIGPIEKMHQQGEKQQQ